MQRIIKSILYIYSMLVIVGCTQTLPLVSHAHVGHALTAWRDTPGEQGLFVVAEKELETAIQETQAAIISAPDQTRVNNHLHNILIALNPELSAGNSKTAYGAVKALNGATDHIVFAAESEDASQNLKKLAMDFATAQVTVLDRVQLAAEVTRLAQQSRGQEQRDLLLQLRTTLTHAQQGEDIDHNGKIGPGQKEYGFQQLREMISVSLRNENPAYSPVEKKYLFGLIRLPSGGWVYRFDTSGENETTTHHDSDKSYGYF